jgi:hypothetical protein
MLNELPILLRKELFGWDIAYPRKTTGKRAGILVWLERLHCCDWCQDCALGNGGLRSSMTVKTCRTCCREKTGYSWATASFSGCPIPTLLYLGRACVCGELKVQGSQMIRHQNPCSNKGPFEKHVTSGDEGSWDISLLTAILMMSTHKLLGS